MRFLTPLFLGQAAFLLGALAAEEKSPYAPCNPATGPYHLDGHEAHLEKDGYAIQYETPGANTGLFWYAQRRGGRVQYILKNRSQDMYYVARIQYTNNESREKTIKDLYMVPNGQCAFFEDDASKVTFNTLLSHHVVDCVLEQCNT